MFRIIISIYFHILVISVADLESSYSRVLQNFPVEKLTDEQIEGKRQLSNKIIKRLLIKYSTIFQILQLGNLCSLSRRDEEYLVSCISPLCLS